MADEVTLDPGAVFVPLTGERRSAPREWEPGLLVLENVPAEEWQAVEVRLNSRMLPVRLERVGGEACVAVPWERTSAGNWALEVRWPGAPVWSRHIRILPAKISEAALSAMVDDLEGGLPASIALALDRLGAFGGVAWQPPRQASLAQEIENVRRTLKGDHGRPGLIDVLTEVARDPHTVLADVRPWVRAEKARRPAAAHLPAAFAKSGNLTRDGRPLAVIDSRVEHTYDVYENRLLRSFADAAAARLRRLQRWLRLSTALAGDIEAEMRTLALALRKARRSAAFLDHVGLLRRAPTDLTMVLLRKPAYRAALEGYLAFRRSARLQAALPSLDAPMEDIPALYESWGTLMLVLALLEAAGDAGLRVTAQHLCSGAEGDPAVVLPPEIPAVRLEGGDGHVVILTPQRRFPRRGGGLHSISFEQIPDVTLEVERDGRRALFLFDPKYKLWGDGIGEGVDGRPKKEDIDKMHAYRDAIRDADGERPVRLAAILYPGPEAWFGDDIAALQARPGDDGFRGRLRELLVQRIRLT